MMVRRGPPWRLKASLLTVSLGAAVPVSAPTPTVELQGKRLVYRPMPMPEDAKGSNRDELLRERSAPATKSTPLRPFAFLTVRSEFCKVLAQASTASEKIEVIPEQFYPLAVSSGHESYVVLLSPGSTPVSAT